MKKDNKKITLIILDEEKTNTVNISNSSFNLIKPFIFLGIPIIVAIIVLSFVLSFFFWKILDNKKNYYKYVNIKSNLINNYSHKEKELEIAKKEVLEYKKEILESKKDLQKLKNYLQKRGVHIKPSYKGDLGKINSNKENVGGPFNLNKFHLNINKKISSISPINVFDIKSMYTAIQQIPTGYPYVGIITSLFGYRLNPISNTGREFHRGIDIKGNYGGDIKVTANGIVSYAGYYGGYGNVIKVTNGFGYSTFYAHLSKIGVKIGDKVKAGQVIGQMGSTGRSTGVHLHYEVRQNNEAINPELFLNIVD